MTAACPPHPIPTDPPLPDDDGTFEVVVSQEGVEHLENLSLSRELLRHRKIASSVRTPVGVRAPVASPNEGAPYSR